MLHKILIFNHTVVVVFLKKKKKNKQQILAYQCYSYCHRISPIKSINMAFLLLKENKTFLLATTFYEQLSRTAVA